MTASSSAAPSSSARSRAAIRAIPTSIFSTDVRRDPPSPFPLPRDERPSAAARRCSPSRSCATRRATCWMHSPAAQPGQGHKWRAELTPLSSMPWYIANGTIRHSTLALIRMPKFAIFAHLRATRAFDPTRTPPLPSAWRAPPHPGPARHHAVPARTLPASCPRPTSRRFQIYHHRPHHY